MVSRITPWAAGGAKRLRHEGCPLFIYFRERVSAGGGGGGGRVVWGGRRGRRRES